MALSVASFAQSASNTTSPKTSSTTWSAGDRVVVFAMVENNTGNISTPTATGLTFNQVASQGPPGNGSDTGPMIECWVSDPAASGDTQNVSVSESVGGKNWEFSRWVITGNPGTVESDSNLTESAFSEAVAAGDVVIYGFNDWNDVAAGRTGTTGSGSYTERVDDTAPTGHTIYAGDWVGTAAGTFSFGVTDYSGLNVAHAVVIIHDAVVLSDGAFIGGHPSFTPFGVPLFIPQPFDESAVGGTTFTADLAGTIASAAALIRDVSLVKTATGTTAGALVKAVTKPGLAGSISTAGALLKQAQKLLAGSIATSGALTSTKVILRSFTATIATAGALVKAVSKPLTGTAATAGALRKDVTKPGLAGSIATSGALVKAVSKLLAGSIATAGAVTAIKVVLRTLTGAIASAGALVRSTSKTTTGTAATAGAVTRSTSKALTGTVATAGALRKAVSRTLTGSVATAGTLTRLRTIAKLLSGAIGLAGSVATQVGAQFLPDEHPIRFDVRDASTRLDGRDPGTRLVGNDPPNRL